MMTCLVPFFLLFNQPLHLGLEVSLVPGIDFFEALGLVLELFEFRVHQRALFGNVHVQVIALLLGFVELFLKLFNRIIQEFLLRGDFRISFLEGFLPTFQRSSLFLPVNSMSNLTSDSFSW